MSAGMGTRLGNLTKSCPKALQKVNGKTIVQHDIAWAKYLGSDKIIVIGGYEIDQLRSEIEKINSDVQIVENVDFATTQRMTSLLKTENEIEGDMLVLDGDYIYHKDIADYVLNNEYKDITVHASENKSEYMAQDVIVDIDDDNRFVNNYKTVGTEDLKHNQLYFNSLLYCPEKHRKDFFDSARTIIDDMKNNQVHLEAAILEYSKNNTVMVRNIKEPLWMEIDTPEELESAERFVKKYKDDIPC